MKAQEYRGRQTDPHIVPKPRDFDAKTQAANKRKTQFRRKRREESDWPASDAEFFERFGTDEQCYEFIVRTRWPNGFICPRCGAGGVWLAAGGYYRCDIGHSISATCETAMHGTRTPLRTWFYAAWLLATHKPGVSALQLALRKARGTGYTGTWGTLQKIRSRFDQSVLPKLAGYVEVDEMYVGGRERGTGNTGRGAVSKSLVAIAVEVEVWRDAHDRLRAKAGRCRLQIIPAATKDALHRFIADNIEPGATVNTDSNSSYGGLEKLGYDRDVINAGTDDDPLPVLGRVTTNLKRWLMGTHKGSVRKQHLQAYLDEFVFRFNRRYEPWTAFGWLLNVMAVPAKRSVEYRELWAQGRNASAAKKLKIARKKNVSK